jgi:dTDP-4-dehydrorhamnose 3,5-epimerase
MIITQTEMLGVYIIEPQVFSDSRGWFMETYSQKKIPQIDCVFVQDNHSFSAKKGTLRGIHFQYPPMQQAKLVRCTKGSALDIVVDLRKESATYKKWISVKLSAENKKQLFIPRGLGHGFITLEDNTEVFYKTDNYYSAEHDGTILWCDAELGINWGTDNPILSEKDTKGLSLKEAEK